MSEYSSWATVTDLEHRWRALTPEESERASVLLSDASAQVDIIIGDYDASDAETQYIKSVVCSAVIDAMQPRSGDAFGLGQAAGLAWEPSNASSTVKIDWAAEKKLRKMTGKRLVKVVPLCP